jgi:hypothetical protein
LLPRYLSRHITADLGDVIAIDAENTTGPIYAGDAHKRWQPCVIARWVKSIWYYVFNSTMIGEADQSKG